MVSSTNGVSIAVLNPINFGATVPLRRPHTVKVGYSQWAARHAVEVGFPQDDSAAETGL